ncbi:ABC transporter permease [Sphingobacterium paludis]|uniref:Putative ABC transport system permease protein n=1 Tax=Sphingobacterium paludis TaxID=1476465 RepID=A0A4R7D6X3_9SPHI|nr:FtsX-like permease family protein [Sphingobacterium paludis]TDS15951.1 putative ABC transport system permease protein [Sphingobacterium paludis]
MILNYIKIAWRSIVKNRFFSLLNVLGLAISLAAAILLLSFARQEWSYNKQFAKESSIYRVYLQATAEYNFEKWTNLPNAVGPNMLTDIPEVKSFARLVKLDFTGFASIQAKEDTYIEKKIFLTDSAFFDIFDVEFLEGSRQSSFSRPKSVVISASEKKKLFGDSPALNQTIVLNQRDTVNIAGVFQDFPTNSSFDATIFLNMMDSWMGTNVYWSNASYQTFCLLDGKAIPADVEQKATALIDKYVPKDDQYYTQFFLQPLSKVHLYSADLKDNILRAAGDIASVKMVILLAALVILIACINYMNLATARSQRHAKEVGINKVLGAHPHQIKIRFYLETGLITFFSIGAGLMIALAMAPVFNNLVGSNISATQLFSAENMGLSLALWLVTTLLGGSYPATLMARIPSLSLMKKMTSSKRGMPIFRQGLVLFQFTCSTILIIGVIVISLQMKHVANKDLGYQPSNIMIVPIRSIPSTDKYQSIKKAVEDLAGTVSTATVQSFPGYGESGKNVYNPSSPQAGLPTSNSSTNGPVVQTLGLHLLAGTDLPQQLNPNDTTCYVLINEVVSSFLGYADPNDAIGKNVSTEMSRHSVISGVVRNFNFNSLKGNIGGYVYSRMNNPSEGYRYLLLRYDTNRKEDYVAQIQSIFETQIPQAAFDYQFLDDHIKSFYTAESRTNNIVATASILTIVVACIGLFGLAAFTAEQRKKEIGVRKVLGSSIYNIVQLLSAHFLLLTILSLIIASPIAWWIFSEWLQNFNDKISIPWWSFLVAGLFSTGIAVLTIGYQALKAARANPINSLRDE